MNIDLNSRDCNLIRKTIGHYMDLSSLTEEEYKELDDLLFYISESELRSEQLGI